MKPVLSKLLLACGLALSLPALADTWLIRDARVFDGEKLHARRSVLVQDEKIVDADFRGPVPPNARIVEGAGRTLLPGLIDAHVHAFQQFELPLLFGVTTQLDMFTSVSVLQEMNDRMRRHDNRTRADVISAGTLVTAPDGHGTEYGMTIPTLTRPEDAQSFVDARIAEGSHFIKIVMEDGGSKFKFKSLDLATVRAVIAAAHKRGKLAVVHIGNLANARAALEAGADGLAHLFVGRGLSEAEVQDFVRLAREKRAFIVPTLSVLESVAGLRADDLLADAGLTALLTNEELAPLKVSFGQQPAAAIMTSPRQLVAALSKAGVPLLAGTDAGNPGTLYGISLLHEVAALVQAGLTPVQALAAATSAPAKAFRLQDRGRIAKGYKADLVLVQGDAASDVTALHHIVEVWKDGAVLTDTRQAKQQQVAQALQQRQQGYAALPHDGRISQFTPEHLGSALGMGWMASSDQMMGGQSQVDLKVLEAGADGQRPLEIRAKVATGFAFPWAGVAYMPGAQPLQPADLRAAKLLRFRVKGDGQRYVVAMLSSGSRIPVNVGFATSDSWQEVVLRLEDFRGVDFGAVTMIAFNAGPQAGDYQFQIADVRLVSQ
ncbi:CIA30 family protein [Pseudoduganella danionis]|uniref:Amidohydrolase family protein n=1 Tax=Pseudoduganella danionis TaxID=1890295 RepID=A0ABW9SI23_9BURK|nr:CIA30 family protein [Pseudoduganella danionis]MTW31743.1 amidohydrolase family protein [Pseudoduganella danionis]